MQNCFVPVLSAGTSKMVNLSYHEKGQKQLPPFKTETRAFSLNYFTRSRKKVGA